MPQPSKRTPALMEELIERLSKGEPLARICDSDHMPSFQTVWRWEKENAEVREDLAQARALGTHYMADDCLQIADGPGDPADKRIRIDTRLRLIGKWNAKVYGDTAKVEVSGPDGGPVEVSDSQAQAKLAAIMAAAKARKEEASEDGDDLV